MQDGKGGGEGFEVQKYGDGRVALIGNVLSAVLPSDDLQTNRHVIVAINPLVMHT